MGKSTNYSNLPAEDKAALARARGYALYLYTRAQERGIKGFELHHAAALGGHWRQESDVKADATPDGTPGAGYALMQVMHTPRKPTWDRFQRLKDYAKENGKNWKDAHLQMDFILHEMFDPRVDQKGRPLPPYEKKAGEALLAAKTIDEAYEASHKYVRFDRNPRTAHEEVRQGDARWLYAQLPGELQRTQLAKTQGAAPPENVAALNDAQQDEVGRLMSRNASMPATSRAFAKMEVGPPIATAAPISVPPVLPKNPPSSADPKHWVASLEKNITLANGTVEEAAKFAGRLQMAATSRDYPELKRGAKFEAQRRGLQQAMIDIYGAEGIDKILKKAGFENTEFTADAKFGPKTAAVVRAFGEDVGRVQERLAEAGVTHDKVLGAGTRRAIQAADPSLLAGAPQKRADVTPTLQQRQKQLGADHAPSPIAT
jgi:hypothetical protein